jgi:hypothetical protein
MRGYGLGWISALALTSRGSDRVVAVRVRGANRRETLWLATPVDARFGEPAAAFVAWVGRRRPTSERPREA